MRKALFLGAAVALIFIILGLRAVLADSKPVSPTQKIYPYAIEVNSPNGRAETYSGSSTSFEIPKIAQDLGTVVYPEDRVKTFPELNFLMGAKISVKRAPAVTVTDWGKKTLYRSFAPTVGAFFAEKNIEIGDDDKVNFSNSTSVTDGMAIVITRVAITNVSENKPIDFRTIIKDDPNLDEGKTRIDRAGKSGTMKYTYRVTRENGVQKSKILISKEKTLDPVDQLQARGTRPVITVRCNYNDTVIKAAVKYSYKANDICNLMIRESQGNPNSVWKDQNGNDIYFGLFQYTIGGDGNGGSWADISKKAGYGGRRWTDPEAQIMTTVWALTHGYSSKW